MLRTRSYLILALIVVVVLVFSWLKPVHNAIDNQRQTQSSEPKEYIPQNVPVTIHEVHPEQNSGQSDHKQNRSAATRIYLWINELLLKFIYDPVAIGTAGVAIFTLGLFRSSRTDARDDLRAYVLLEDTFFIHKNGEDSDHPSREYTDTHKLRIKNFGKTPAFEMSIWLRRSPTDLGEPEINILLAKAHSEQPLAPGQRYGPNFAEQSQFRHTDRFFVYGRIVYRDIYGRWWVTRFGWRYDGPRPDLRFSPHGPHNREEGPFHSKPP